MKINCKSVVTGQIKNLFSYYGWPSVCADENDVLYTACSGHRMGHVCPFGKTMVYKSRDMGKSWSSPVLADDSYFDDRDTGIVYLGKGKMLVTNFKHPVDVYKQHYTDAVAEAAGQLGLEMLALCDALDEEDKKGGSFYLISNDYGETWGEKKRIPISCPHGPIKLDNGSLLYVGKEMYSYGSEKADVIAAYTADTEKIDFVRTGSCKKPAEYGWDKFHEPHCVQLESGRILAFYRAQIDENGNNFTMYQAYSDDNGKSWSDAQATGICGSPPHLLRLSDGRVLLSYARRMKPYGIYARIIDSDGSQWSDEILIDGAADSDIGYPASVQLNNGDIVTVFYKREISNRYTSIVAVNWCL